MILLRQFEVKLPFFFFFLLSFCLVVFYLLFFFLIYALPYSLLLLISAAAMGYCITDASRQTPTSYRLLPTNYKCLLFSMYQVPDKSIVQKPCSIQMDFTKYCTVINSRGQNVSPIAYMTQLLPRKVTQPPGFSNYADSQLSQEWNYHINHRLMGCIGNDI